jgi:hypothetical protein
MREFVSILVLSAALIAAPSLAGPGKAKRNGPHPSASAFEHANENARFKRDDWSAAKRRADDDENDKKSKTDKKAKKDKKHAADDQDTEKRATRKAENKDSEKSKAKDSEESPASDERKAGKRQTEGRTAAKR